MGRTGRQCLCLVEMREIGKEPQLAGLKRCRETFDEETPPILRCGGNQQGNLRNEDRPCAAMTGPTRAGDKRVTLLRWGDSPASMDWSRRTPFWR